MQTTLELSYGNDRYQFKLDGETGNYTCTPTRHGAKLPSVIVNAALAVWVGGQHKGVGRDLHDACYIGIQQSNAMGRENAS